MGKCKLTINFDGFDKMLRDIKNMGGNINEIAENALYKSRDYINTNLENAMTKHNRTYQTVESIKNAKIEWHGTVAKLPVGFDIKNGGMASIFLMYGTPRMKKDTKLYNAIYGKETKNKVAEIQKAEFKKNI